MARTAAKLTVVEQPGIGHNSAPTEAIKLLQGYVDRVEKLLEERKETNEVISSIYTEAGGQGFDKGVLRKLIAYRQRLAKDANKVSQEEEQMDIYKHALGM
jgi:uncharacterized protein (UPF0335 family)